jgi:putative lipoic acid-binding regulatory protein
MAELQEPPKIEFPCADYPIKAIGVHSLEFRELVVRVVREHAPDFDETTVEVIESRAGRFASVRFRITATGVDQLRSL